MENDSWIVMPVEAKGNKWSRTTIYRMISECVDHIVKHFPGVLPMTDIGYLNKAFFCYTLVNVLFTKNWINSYAIVEFGLESIAKGMSERKDNIRACITYLHAKKCRKIYWRVPRIICIQQFLILVEVVVWCYSNNKIVGIALYLQHKFDITILNIYENSHSIFCIENRIR